MPIRNTRLFVLSCIALTVTAMTFGVRAGVLNQLGTEFGLTNTQLGVMNSMAFLGFPIAMLVGGLVYNSVGPKALMIVAFFGHLIGLALTITANGYWLLLISTFCIGLANGAVEAACNPMLADLYSRNKTATLNRFHVWFPGGIVIGTLIVTLFNQLNLGWQAQIAVMILPTLVYGFMVFTEAFPAVSAAARSTGENLKALLSPLFIFMVVLMTITATTELGTSQWIDKILKGSGASPMLILALVTGVMAAARFFAGPLVHALNPVGVLVVSAILSAAGLFLLSQTSGQAVYAAAVVFALGVAYFWPTMIGFVGEYLPKTGALGMSLIGGAGNSGVSLWNPVIGGWIDSAAAKAAASGLEGAQADVMAGRAALQNLVLFPVVLIVAFGLLAILRPKRGVEPH